MERRLLLYLLLLMVGVVILLSAIVWLIWGRTPPAPAQLVVVPVRFALSRNHFDIVNGLSQIYPQDIYRLGDGIHKHWLTVRRSTIFSRLYDKVSPRHRLLLHLEKKIFSPGNYKRIITNSELCKGHAIDYYKVPPELVDVIY